MLARASCRWGFLFAGTYSAFRAARRLGTDGGRSGSNDEGNAVLHLIWAERGCVWT